MNLKNCHRVFVTIKSELEWYQLMAECRTWFGKNWRTQAHVRKKLRKFGTGPIEVWFEVPDANWSSWVAVKLGTQVKSIVETNK